MARDDMLFDPPDNANEALFDAMVRHQVYLMRLSGSIRNRINTILNRTEADLADKIIARLQGYQGKPRSVTEARMETLKRILANTRTKAWEEVNEAWAQELVDLSKAEPEHMAGMVATTAPVVVDTILPAPRLLRSIALSKPFQGRVLKEWADNVADEDIRRIHSEVQMGMTAGETPKQIARRVVGTARMKGQDGATQITRNNAAAITRTAVNHIANRARNEFMAENSDLFQMERYVATLDSRTTPVCRANDGLEFKVGQGPIPPLHFNCRSLRVAALNPEALVDRPAKAATERMLLREFAKKQRVAQVQRRADLPHGTKGAFDQFKRQRVRELTGRVPAATNYQSWLSKQSREFQEDVLGKTKAKLVREGKLKPVRQPEGRRAHPARAGPARRPGVPCSRPGSREVRLLTKGPCRLRHPGPR